MIPEGYRLLTAEDVGKVFGVDLESTVYFDTSLSLPNPYSSSVIYFTNFIRFNYLDEESWYINNTTFNITQVFLIDSYTFTENVEITSYNTNYQDWNDFLYVKDIVDPKEQFITDMNSLAESIVGKAGSSGKKTIKEMKTLVDGLKTEFVTQEKTVTPTKASQAITPDSGKDGLSKVTVNAIPDEYIVPSGELEITENGTHDVTDKASVVVNVPVPVIVQWDGAYEEIVSGFTLTINTSTDGMVISGIYYSLDNGVSWNEITLEALTIENVSQIKIKSEFNFGMLNIGTTEGGSDIYSSLGYQAETDNITLDKDTTIYITNIGYPGMP